MAAAAVDVLAGWLEVEPVVVVVGSGREAVVGFKMEGTT